MKQIKKILCPVDFSDLSDETIEIAIQLAEKYSASFHIIYVLSRPKLYDWSLSGLSATVLDNWYEETKKEVSAKVNALVELIQKDHPEVIITSELSEMVDPADGIMEAAATQNSDLIIMGSHGRKGLSRILMGSVAEAVLRHAPCAVMIYKKEVRG